MIKLKKLQLTYQVDTSFKGKTVHTLSTAFSWLNVKFRAKNSTSGMEKLYDLVQLCVATG